MTSVLGGRGPGTSSVVTTAHVDDPTDGRGYSAVLWSPLPVPVPRPLVLIGHVAGQHKEAPAVRAVAGRVVRDLGFHAMAIDAPGHGEFASERMAPGARTDRAERDRIRIERTRSGARRWRTALDVVSALPGVSGPFGYWGLSMGAQVGVALAAAEPRIRAVVLGLAGRPESAFGDAMARYATQVRQAVLFLVQEHDEIVGAADARRLFDALATDDKRWVVNPGHHGEVPLDAVRGACSFLGDRLSRPPATLSGTN